MGVRDLWTVLSPVKEQVPLSSLAGKTLAVDLSGWICQATSSKPLAQNILKPHLRQLFVRVFRLHCEGVRLVVVLDGEAVQLKWATMDTRAKMMGGACFYGYQRSSGARSALNRQIKECVELLDVLGVPHLQSKGEAEALCALLNMKGYVDGVLTQDGDAFLYGATVVYKDLSITDSTVACYTAANIESQLGLTRTDLVSLALLVGCDYCQGVPRVGRVGALEFIASCKPQDSLDVMKGWKSGEGSECKVQRLAGAVAGFPSLAVIGEFMTPKDTLPSRDQLCWQMPLVIETQLFCERALEWSPGTTCKKTRALLIKWVLSEKGYGHEIKDKAGTSCSIHPTHIVKSKREKKINCYEVNWSAELRLAGQVGEDADPGNVEFTTIENVQRLEKAYPDLCLAFKQRKSEKQRTKKRTKSKVTKSKQPAVLSPGQSTLEGILSPEKPLVTTSSIDSLTLASEIVDSKQLSSTEQYHTPPHPIPPHSLTSLNQVDSDPDDELSLFDRIRMHSKLTASDPTPHTTAPDSAHHTTAPDSAHHTTVSDPTPHTTAPDSAHHTTTPDSAHHTTVSDPIPHTTASVLVSANNTCPPPTRSLGAQVEYSDRMLRTPSPVIVSSDDEEPLPLLLRIRKSPIKVHIEPLPSTKLTPNVKQLRLDSCFPQRKARQHTKATSARNLGSKSEPILID